MRVIAGKYGGRRLASVPKDVRPSSDRLRGTLFEVLGPTVEGSVWLDPFAGTGAIGIEALSRGARHVIFSDRNGEALRVMRTNLGMCGVAGAFEIHKLDAFALLRKLVLPTLDFVFLDPPYHFGRHEKLLGAVSGLGSVDEKTRIILEVFKKTDMKCLPQGLVAGRTLRLGDSHLVFLSRRP